MNAYLFLSCFKSMFERKKCPVVVVDLCVVRTHSPSFTFVPMGNWPKIM